MKPEPLPVGARKDLKKYCAFHEMACHHTSECKALKEQIEDLVRDDRLNEWVASESTKAP